MGMPMGMVPGMFPQGTAPPQRSGGPVPIPTPADSPADASVEESAPDSDDDEPDAGDDGITDVAGAIATAMAASPIEEVEALRHENEQLRSGMAGASTVIDALDNQPMPPIVGEDFVIPAHVVSDFVRIGRQLQRDGLCHGTAGTISTISLDQPNLVHITRAGAPLGHLDERSIESGRLGEPGPPAAGDAWRLHTVLLALASIENGGRAACFHLPAPYTTTMSLEQDLFVLRPSDLAGLDHFEKVVIVDSDDVTSDDFLRQLTEGLTQSGHAAVVVRGGGMYAVGADFNSAWDNAASLENSMKVALLARLADIDL
jgi:ribulose-5-phosphate 4-epimerase/fuculose-1-phosphate aldolase